MPSANDVKKLSGLQWTVLLLGIACVVVMTSARTADVILIAILVIAASYVGLITRKSGVIVVAILTIVAIVGMIRL